MHVEIFKNKFIEIIEVVTSQPPLLNLGRWKVLPKYTPPEFHIPKKNLDKQTILYLDNLAHNIKVIDKLTTYVNHFSGNKTITNHRTIENTIITTYNNDHYILRYNNYI